MTGNGRSVRGAATQPDCPSKTHAKFPDGVWLINVRRLRVHLQGTRVCIVVPPVASFRSEGLQGIQALDATERRQILVDQLVRRRLSTCRSDRIARLEGRRAAVEQIDARHHTRT
jgi:hypothetical protein